MENMNYSFNEQILNNKQQSAQLYNLVKNIFDFVCALVGIILLLPLFILIAIAIKITSKGPVFFKHERVGQNKKTFYIYKFRTMVIHAEELKKQFTKEQLREYQENFKLKDDPRVTYIGKLLRKTSLDELPQLFNILLGDMSIVGPRPVVLEELEKYGEYVDELLSVKSGLTGMWQANGRSDTTYEERVKMDISYINNMSILLDIKIIFSTFLRVIKCTGAY